jgi:type I restriction enzyme, S subunit
LGEIVVGGFSNGVFNDPNKLGRGYRLINVKDMYNGNFIDISSLSRLELDDQEFRRNKAEYGDVFFTRSSLVKEGIAHSNILLSRDQDITYDGHLIRFCFNHKSYLPEFIALALKAGTTRKQLVSRGKTGTMTTIGQDDIATVTLSIPSKKEQEKIADFLIAIDQKIDAIAKQIDLTEHFKKGLLQKMFV